MCDGCINLKAPHNAGLHPVINFTEPLYQDVKIKFLNVSRADFWQLAGIAAIELGITRANSHVSINS